jgi:hypothetical protein
MIGFIGTSLQLQSIITAHNQWLPTTRSIPYWTTNVFSFTVTDLVPIYESVTSSTSVVRWLTLPSWTLNSLTNPLIHECTLFYKFGWTDEIIPPRTYRLLFCYSFATKRSCWTVAQQWIISCLFVAVRTRVASNGLTRSLHCSGFLDSCHNIPYTCLRYGSLLLSNVCIFSEL